MGDHKSVLTSGFHHNVTGCKIGQPSSFYYPYKKNGFNGEPYAQDIPGMEDGNEGDYLTDKLTDKAISYMEHYQIEPFLLYISYYQTHKPRIAPAQGKKEFVDFYKAKLHDMPDEPGSVTREEVHGKAVVTECLVQRNAEFAG
jgi:hypothetical protein